MLEKFKSKYGEYDFSIKYNITNQMYIAKNMKAFEWKYAQITMNNGISNWNKMEYFDLSETDSMTRLPTDFNGLSNLKYLSLEFVGLTIY